MAQPSIAIKALLFDTFGSVVDWRGSLIRELSRLGAAQGVTADWAAFADCWRGQYQPQMGRVRSGALGWVKLDDLHREILDKLLPEFGLSASSEAHASVPANASKRCSSISRSSSKCATGRRAIFRVGSCRCW